MKIDPKLFNELLETFKTELDEQLLSITNSLLKLEKGTSKKEKETTIATIFRAAHNIKGTSRSLGITDISLIAHQVETLFSSIQKNILPISSHLIDVCLEAADKIRFIMQAFIEKKPLTFNVAEFVDKLESVQSKKENTPVKKLEKEDNFKDSLSGDTTATNTIRVPIKNIDQLSTLMEEIQINKIAIDDQYKNLKQLVINSRQFYEIWEQILYFIKGTSLSVSPNFQKLYDVGTNYFLKMSDALISLQKNMRTKLSDLSLLSNELQDEMRTLRLLPISNLLCTMPRYVRDLAQELHKKVELKITGDDVKVDKMLIEKLRDPIIHLLRNAIDHGIEAPEVRLSKGKSDTGSINIEINEENNQIIIKVIDDGVGINIVEIANIAKDKKLVTESMLEKMNNIEKLHLIFLQGLSIKESITDVSGRGVGLDVVKANVENLKGHIDVMTEVDKYTQFELRLPLTLASEKGLVITCGEQIFIFPLNSVAHVVSILAKDILEIEGTQAVMLDGHPVPLQKLADLLGLEAKVLSSQQQIAIVFIKSAQDTVGFVVDKILGEREIVIKPLHAPLTNLHYISGGTLSGNNQVIIVLNPNDLINNILKGGHRRHIEFKEDKDKKIVRPKILIVDDSITTRTLEKNILESKNYDVTVAVNGKEAWDLLQKQSFSLVITDIVMPIMDGFELTEQVKKNEKLQNLPVIIVTSLESDAEKKRGIEVGADAYIVKNQFESGMLLEIVEQLV